MDRWLEFFVTVFVSMIGSSGVWTLVMKRMEKKDSKTKLLLGLTQRSIVEQCREYCKRGGWITEDEYENLHEYLWKPYQELGGNGLAKKWIDRVEELKIVSNDYKPNKYYEE